MGMPDVPEICAELPPPPEAPDISPDVRCARNNEPKRVQDVRAPSCRMNRPDEEDVVIDEAIVTAIFPLSPVEPNSGSLPSKMPKAVHTVAFGSTSQEPILIAIFARRCCSRGRSAQEFFGLTEIVIASGEGGYRRVGQADVPEPVVVRDPAAIAGGPGIPTGQLTEMLESVLVEVRNIRVTNTAPDCPVDYDMFALDGNLRIEDEVGLDYQPALGDVVERVTGILHYSFETNKIIPRSNRDLVATSCGGLPHQM